MTSNRVTASFSHILALLLLLGSRTTSSESASASTALEHERAETRISYALAIEKPESGDVEVSILVENAPESDLEFVLPCWAPGRFLRDDFAACVSQEEAILDGGAALPVERPGSHVFRIEARSRAVLFRYRIFAGHASVGTSLVNESGALLNPASLLPYLRQGRKARCEVYVTGPKAWRWAASLPAGERPGHFVAGSYDELAAATILGGQLSEQLLQEGETKVRVFAISANERAAKALAAQSQELIKAATKFCGPWQSKEASLLVDARSAESSPGFRCGRGFALVVAQPDAAARAQADLAGACAGLAFGSALQPDIESLGDFRDLPMRDDLWVAPSFLRYFGRQLIHRSGLEGEGGHLQELAARLETAYNEQAAKQMNLKTAARRMALRREKTSQGLDADQGDDWIDPILRGEIIAMLLDLELRGDSDGRLGLVDLARQLAKGDEAFSLDRLRFVIEAKGGRNLLFSFEDYLEQRQTPRHREALAKAGYRLETSEQAAFLGIELDGDRILTVRSNSAAERSGLESRDRILRIGGEAVGEKAGERIASMTAGTRTTMTIERRGRIITLPLTVDTLVRRGWNIVPTEDEDKLAIRAGFLGIEVNDE